MIVPLQFSAQYYTDMSLPVSAQDLCNMYISEKKEGSISRIVLQPTPGLTVFCELGAESDLIRCVHRVNDQKMYVVSGTKLYSVDENGISTDVMTIPGTARVVAASNATDTLFVCNKIVYFVNSTSSGVLDVGFLAGDIVFQDSYLLLSEHDTQKFYINDLISSPPVFSAFDFSLANFAADKIIGLASFNRTLFVMGEYSIQAYYNSGAFNFPFSIARIAPLPDSPTMGLRQE